MARRSRVALILMAVAMAAPPLAARQAFSRQDAERCRTKLARITQLGTVKSTRPSGTTSTVMSDTEINAYLRYDIAADIPAGIVDPTLTALGNGRVSGRATVDLDAVRAQKARGWLDPMAYLTGSLPLTATGTLITSGGVGRFQLESAEVSGITIPKSLLQELLTYYSRSAERPGGISIDDPFDLPARIREIRVDVGQATVVQ